MAHLEDNRSRSARRLAHSFLSWRAPRHMPPSEGWIPPTLAVVLIGGWEVAVRTSFVSALFFPAPSAIASTLVKLLGNGVLLANIAATLGRLLLGMILVQRIVRQLLRPGFDR